MNFIKYSILLVLLTYAHLSAFSNNDVVCDYHYHIEFSKNDIPSYRQVASYITKKEEANSLLMEVNDGQDYLALQLSKRKKAIDEYHLTDKEFEDIENYTMYEYERINRIKRGDLKANKSDLSMISRIDSGIEKLPFYQGVSYRGMELDEGEFKTLNYRIGETFQDRAFISTDKNIHVGIKFSGLPEDGELYGDHVLFVIYGKSGKDISQISNNAIEAEVLYPPGVQFKILAIEKHNGINVMTMIEKSE